MESIYQKKYDVVVAGGGVSGAAAAIAAARQGADTLIIEQSGFLGGALTSFGVGPMMTFFAGETQVIKGIMQEIADRLAAGGYGGTHVKDTTQYISYTTPFNSEGLKLVLDELAQKAGCTVLFHTFIAGVQTEADEITALSICNKDGLKNIKSAVYIDATGDGDVMAWAGEEFTKGRPADGAAQPMTMNMKFCNVDTAALKNYVKQNMADFTRLEHHIDLMDSPAPLALAGMDSVFNKAKQNGELNIPREDVLMFETNRPGEFIINTTRIINKDATNAHSLSLAETEGRRQCAELAAFFKKYLPGFENALLEFTGPSVGVRGSRQLAGKYVLTAQDILQGRRFASAIAHSGYPIDIHSPDGEGTRSRYPGEEGDRPYYDIPYEILVPKTIKNLLVTGRCASASFEAQASIRVTPSAGAIGQAAGTAAAIAAKNGQATADVNTAALQKVLRENGAYIEGI